MKYILLVTVCKEICVSKDLFVLSYLCPFVIRIVQIVLFHRCIFKIFISYKSLYYLLLRPH